MLEDVADGRLDEAKGETDGFCVNNLVGADPELGGADPELGGAKGLELVGVFIFAAAFSETEDGLEVSASDIAGFGEGVDGFPKLAKPANGDGAAPFDVVVGNKPPG